jgi:hypothetical protein
MVKLSKCKEYLDDMTDKSVIVCGVIVTMMAVATAVHHLLSLMFFGATLGALTYLYWRLQCQEF